MKPYLKNVNTLVLDEKIPVSIQYCDNKFVVIDGRFNSRVHFFHYENAIFCALTIMYDTLTNSIDELPFVDIVGDFNLIDSKFEVLLGCKDFDEEKTDEK